MKIWRQLILITVISSSVNAGDDPIKNLIFNNISHEFVECASYFSIVAQGIRNRGDETLAIKYDQASNVAIKYAVMSAEEGRTTEMAQKVTLSRFEMGLKILLKEVDNDASNISILSNKYAFRCKTAMENPEAMMNDWVNKELDKHSQAKKPGMSSETK